MTEAKKRNKKVLGIVFICAAVVLLFGGLFAYFSDIIQGEAEVTAGTLDLEGDFVAYINFEDPDTNTNTPIVPSAGVVTVDNFNPGDCLTFVGEFENKGTKSAWIRSGISFTAVDAGIKDYIYVIPFDPTTETPLCSTLRSLTSAALESLALSGDGFDTLPVMFGDETIYVVDGTVEEEDSTSVGATSVTGALAIEDVEAKVGYVVYFDRWALNEAQNQEISFSALVEALQFRNNPNPFAPGPTGSGTVWDTVVTTPFSLTPTP